MVREERTYHFSLRGKSNFVAEDDEDEDEEAEEEEQPMFSVARRRSRKRILFLVLFCFSCLAPGFGSEVRDEVAVQYSKDLKMSSGRDGIPLLFKCV